MLICKIYIRHQEQVQDVFILVFSAYLIHFYLLIFGLVYDQPERVACTIRKLDWGLLILIASMLVFEIQAPQKVPSITQVIVFFVKLELGTAGLVLSIAIENSRSVNSTDTFGTKNISSTKLRFSYAESSACPMRIMLAIAD